MTSPSPHHFPTRERIEALQEELSALRKQLADEGASRITAESFPQSLLLVTCGTLGVAIRAHRSVEVLPRLEFEEVAEPLTGIAGTMRYRGAEVRVLDLCARLGSPNITPLLAQRIIVVGAGLKLCGLLVGEAVDVVSVRQEEMTPLAPDAALLHLGVATVRHDGRVFTLLDLDALLAEVPPRP